MRSIGTIGPGRTRFIPRRAAWRCRAMSNFLRCRRSQAIASPADGRNVLDLATLTRILFCANGLTRQRKIDGEDYHFRAAASAGALYPIETYIAAADIDELETGAVSLLARGLESARPAARRLARGHRARDGESSLDRECARDSHHERDFLAQHVEVSGARLSLLLLGRWHYPRESARGRRGGRNQR